MSNVDVSKYTDRKILQNLCLDSNEVNSKKTRQDVNFLIFVTMNKKSYKLVLVKEILYKTATNQVI